MPRREMQARPNPEDCDAICPGCGHWVAASSSFYAKPPPMELPPPAAAAAQDARFTLSCSPGDCPGRLKGLSHYSQKSARGQGAGLGVLVCQGQMYFVSSSDVDGKHCFITRPVHMHVASSLARVASWPASSQAGAASLLLPLPPSPAPSTIHRCGRLRWRRLLLRGGQECSWPAGWLIILAHGPLRRRCAGALGFTQRPLLRRPVAQARARGEPPQPPRRLLFFRRHGSSPAPRPPRCSRCRLRLGHCCCS